jgi:hypothetical protein
MRPFKTAGFCKQRTCPSTEALLSYINDALSLEEGAEITRHLSTCDFCGAELQLLKRFPPKSRTAADNCQQNPIPLYLRIYAEQQLRPEAELVVSRSHLLEFSEHDSLILLET